MQQKSVNEFIKEWSTAWASDAQDWNFRASNGEHTYRGSVKGGKISTIKVQTVSESRAKIGEILSANKTNKT